MKDPLKKQAEGIPGNGFGDEGEGYFRISLTISEKKIKRQ